MTESDYQYQLEYRARNPEQAKLRSKMQARRYKERHPEKWRANCVRGHLAKVSKKIDGMSMDTLLELEQKRKVEHCEICGCGPETRATVLYIDHCHKTRKFRGLICQKCNSALGLLKDDPQIVASALQYLLRERK